MRAIYIIIIILFSIFLATIGGFVYIKTLVDDVHLLGKVKSDSQSLPLRIFDRNGILLAEYGERKQKSYPYEQFPQLLVKAFLAAEDSRFFEHHGVDVNGFFRAATQFVSNSDQQTGGSTITMQLARNYFLSREKTLIRKAKEIILSFKIEEYFSKEEILTIYLNNIFLGFNSFGVGAAANSYYQGRDLKDLTIAEYAMLAVLPKAPSAINPVANPTRALQRRDWILGRMKTLGYINDTQYNQAIQSPNTATAPKEKQRLDINQYYPTELVRLELLDNPMYLGKPTTLDELYNDGYDVITTIDSRLQAAGNKFFLRGLLLQEFNFGYKKDNIPHIEISSSEADSELVAKLQQNIPKEFAVYDNYLSPSIVKNVDENSFTALTEDGKVAKVHMDTVKKYNKTLTTNASTGEITSKKILKMSDVVSVGDIVVLSTSLGSGWQLVQIPELQGAFLSMIPDTGEVVVMIGGFDYKASPFNRATQSNRQVGSTIKPFLYAYGLERGMTPITIINDAPFVDNSLETSNNNIWRPFNDGYTFLGPITIRKALTYSKNLVSIRILDELGVKKTIKYFSDTYDFPKENMAQDLTLALGNVSLTPLQLTEGFATFTNGGYKKKGYLIQQVLSRKDLEEKKVIWQRAEPEPQKPVIDASSVFIINSMMKDVIKYGTARRAKMLKRTDLIGKTGTTNDNKDTWFAGGNSKLLTVVWVGFDDNKKMGANAYGANTALPIWVDFMHTALDGVPEDEVVLPENVVEIKIDSKTHTRIPDGYEAKAVEEKAEDEFHNLDTESNEEVVVESNNIIKEYFKLGTEPPLTNTESANISQSNHNEEVFILE